MDISLQFHKLLLLSQHRVEHECPLAQIAFLEQLLLLLGLKGDIVCQIIDHEEGRIDVAQGKSHLLAIVAHVGQYLEGNLLDRCHDHSKLLVTLSRQFDVGEGHRSSQIGLFLCDLVEHKARPAMQDDIGPSIGQLQHLDDRCHRAHRVEVILSGIISLAVNLAHHTDGHMAVDSLLDQTHALVAADANGHGHAGEKHDIAQRQYGKVKLAIGLQVSVVDILWNFGHDGNNMRCRTLIGHVKFIKINHIVICVCYSR